MFYCRIIQHMMYKLINRWVVLVFVLFLVQNPTYVIMYSWICLWLHLYKRSRSSYIVFDLVRLFYWINSVYIELLYFWLLHVVRFWLLSMLLLLSFSFSYNCLLSLWSSFLLRRRLRPPLRGLSLPLRSFQTTLPLGSLNILIGHCLRNVR